MWEGGKLEASRSGSIEVNFPAGSGVLEIKEVQVIPNPPTVKKPVTFRIKVKNLYSVSKEAKISLEIPEMGFKTDLIEVIAPGDYGIFDIQWNPGEVGLFNVITNLFSREDNGGEKLEDEEHTTVRVRDNLFGRLVPNVNNTVVQGTTVHFDVIVENKDDYPAYNVPIRVFYTYQDPNGEFSDPIRVFERNPRQIDGLGVNITWFNMTLANLGEYYFTLYVNGELEDEKIITVNPEGNVMAWMECDPEFVSEDEDSLSCRVNVKNLGGTTEEVWITNIYFAGGEIYDKSSADNLVIPNPSSLTLNPYSAGAFTFTIPVNDELQERVPVDLSDINLGTPITVKAYLNMLKNPTMFVIQMNPREKGVIKEVKDYIINETESDPWGTSSKIAAIAITGKISIETNPFVLFLTIYGWALIESMKPLPSNNPGDNNLIVGDES